MVSRTFERSSLGSRSRRAFACALAGLCLALAAARGGAQSRDPFRTQEMRPAAPSQFWQGVTVPCAQPVQIPDPLRLADAIDIALCNNPQTRLAWANAKAQAAAVGIARSAYLPDVNVTGTAQRFELRNVPA